ncbi:unnamed protein product [Penicillium viridicatum]
MIVYFLRTQRFTIAIQLLGFFSFILGDLKWDLSASYVGRLLEHYKGIGTDFQVQIFSRDPLITYIHNFVSQDEIDHLLNIRFYNFDYDWDILAKYGNRVTTYMVYLVADCTGGGTNFPRLQRPNDSRWCKVIDCDDDEYSGVTFKPKVGAAVFWENMHPNGSFHRGVRHASLPVKSGQKVGLNIWGWDKEWRPPVELQEKLFLRIPEGR